MKKLTLVLALALVGTGCIGPNNAFQSANSWNSRATDSKWWNELIFVGMWIIPVYPITLLGDIVIFNSIEFFGEENPIREPRPYTPVSDLSTDSADDQ